MSPTPLNPQDHGNVTPLHGNVLRVPPHSVEIERALCGALMMNNKAYDHVVDFLKPEHFTDAAAGRVFQAIGKLIEAGGSATTLTLNAYLENDDVIRSSGGIKYIAALGSGMVTVVNAPEYGRLIFDLFLRREIIQSSEEAINSAYEMDVDVPASAVLDECVERLFNISAATDRHNSITTLEAAGEEAVRLAEIAHKRNGELIGVTTGLVDLDGLIGGLREPDLIILAGRPSMGKTSLGTAIGLNASQYFARTTRDDHQGKQVAFFSLEMSASQLATRILAHLAHLDSHRIRTGKLSHGEMHDLFEAERALAGLPFKIDDKPAATVGAIRTRSRRLARAKGSKGLGLIIVDHLHLMSSTAADRKEGRVLELGAMTRGLKALAKDLNVPVLCLCQLSRAVESRDDKRPQLADLRESGTIEQDADTVMFVYRDEYYLRRAEPKRHSNEKDAQFSERYNTHMELLNSSAGVAEIIIAKQRHGPIGTVTAHFDGPTTWFSDLAKGALESRYEPGMG